MAASQPEAMPEAFVERAQEACDGKVGASGVLEDQQEKLKNFFKKLKGILCENTIMKPITSV